jgi:hypothetical protein
VLNTELRRQFMNGHPDAERIKNLVAEAGIVNAKLEKDDLAFAVKKHFERLSDELAKTPEDPDVLQRFTASAELLPILPFQVDLWKPQNIYSQLTATVLPEIKSRGDEKTKEWTEKFFVLGEKLGFHIHRD